MAAQRAGRATPPTDEADGQRTDVIMIAAACAMASAAAMTETTIATIGA
jgi:hypothetical protein